MANDSYELLPNYDFYNPINAFPSDSILSASEDLIKGNIDVPPTDIDNSSIIFLINTSPDIHLLSRMSIWHLKTKNTGPTTFGKELKK